MGEDVDKPEETSAVDKLCLFCWKTCVKVKRCRSCKSGCYCSRQCRDRHVVSEAHQDLCIPIQQLQEYENDKKVCSVREVVQVPQHGKLVRLVGEKAVINCLIGGFVTTKALWDTGAMVSMVDIEWLRSNFPDEKILPISEFLDGDDLHLFTANNSVLAVEGVVVLKFGLGLASVVVPFVVSSDKLSQPIIGYNVIKHLVKMDREKIPSALVNSIPSLTPCKAEAVVNLIDAEVDEEKEARVMSKTVIPARSHCKVRCQTNFRTDEAKQNVLFSPNILDSELEFRELVAEVRRGKSSVNVVVSNPTNQAFVLKKGLVLGAVEAVSAVIPVVSNEKLMRSATVGKVEAECRDTGVEKWLPDVDLAHLSEEQRGIAEEMLREECEVFCKDKTDHGDVPELQMEIKMTDHEPVVVAHRQIPRPLYEEVKNFINDLIVN